MCPIQRIKAGSVRWCKISQKNLQTLQKKFTRFLFSRNMSCSSHTPTKWFPRLFFKCDNLASLKLVTVKIDVADDDWSKELSCYDNNKVYLLVEAVVRGYHDIFFLISGLVIFFFPVIFTVANKSQNFAPNKNFTLYHTRSLCFHWGCHGNCCHRNCCPHILSYHGTFSPLSLLWT